MPERHKGPEGQLTGRIRRAAKRVLAPKSVQIPVPTLEEIITAREVIEYDEFTQGLGRILTRKFVN